MASAFGCPRAVSSDLRTIAYHEAGHVVVGTRLGLTVLDTDIESDDEGGRGHTHFAPADASDRDQVERVVTTFMAGFAAEVKLGSADPAGSLYDVDVGLGEWLAHLDGNPGRHPDLARHFFARAQSQLEVPGVWSALELVASILLREIRLDGGRARALAAT